jgi:hypothetical protein
MCLRKSHMFFQVPCSLSLIRKHIDDDMSTQIPPVLPGPMQPLSLSLSHTHTHRHADDDMPTQISHVLPGLIQHIVWHT